jgi:hypothetical protein
LNASFGKQFPQCHNSFFYAEIDDNAIRRGNTRQIFTQFWHPVASRVALDLTYWAMRLTLYHLICMVIEMVHEAGPFYSVGDFMSCVTVAKQQCYG